MAGALLTSRADIGRVAEYSHIGLKPAVAGHRDAHEQTSTVQWPLRALIPELVGA